MKNVLSQSYNEPLHKTSYNNFNSSQHSPLKNLILDNTHNNFNQSFDKIQNDITRNLDENKFQTLKDQEEKLKEELIKLN